MAADDYDDITGAPQFAGAGAPDTAVDLTLVAAFAAMVGTRLIGTTAERLAYAFAREGLAWWDTDEDALYVHSGTGWLLQFKDWTSYTPTLGNMTGTAAAAYQVIGETVNVRFRLTVATMGSTPNLSLPINAVDTSAEFLDGQVMFADVSGGTYWPGLLRRTNASAVDLYSVLASGTYGQMGAVTATAPFTWAASDIISANFAYRRA